MKPRTLVIGGLGAVLVLVNVMIAQKEAVLASGDTVFVELAPVDPRSLMQGDYMALDYALAREEAPRDDGRMVVRLDERNIARFVRFDDDAPLIPGQHYLTYKRRVNLRWSIFGTWRRTRTQIGPDAYFFEEGRAAAFSRARYGELKVTKSGHSVLVGLRDANLIALR
jgi:uncharacterized membrane-anchored protein